MTSETERDQRNRIAELERDLSETSGLQGERDDLLPLALRFRRENEEGSRQGRRADLASFRFVPLSTRSSFLAAQYELTLGHLDNAELQVEDLKIQLDDALGAEEMLEALTEKNLEMGEVSRVSFLSSPFLRRGLSPIPLPPVSFLPAETRRDANHHRGSRESQGPERRARGEPHRDREAASGGDWWAFVSPSSSSHSSTRLTRFVRLAPTDLRDVQYRDQKKRAEDLEESLLDHQGTIGQFRDLVISLQS